MIPDVCMFKILKEAKSVSCPAEMILVNFSASMTGDSESSREDTEEEDASDFASLRYIVHQTSKGKTSFGPLVFHNSCNCLMSLGRGANPMVL